jgi:Phosphoinositide phospholipase C, Ca2+-dependent
MKPLRLSHFVRLSFVASVAAFSLSWTALARGAEPAGIEELRINQLQFIGTHNSYHVRNKPSRSIVAWNYTHAPLDVQLNRGVRSVELDLQNHEGVFEVMHVPKLDEGSTCRRLSDALDTIRKWSDGHPQHLPLSILFELKKEGPTFDAHYLKFDAAALERLDEMLQKAFPAERRISPDDVRGSARTLREAALRNGWPTLAASRGKIFFILHDNAQQRAFYEQGHPSLRGRAMFVRSDETRDDAAVMVLDEPRQSEIERLVKLGFFIRTRADADLHTDSRREPMRREAALASGAQIVSTDFPPGERQAGTGYIVQFPGAAPARVNSVNGPPALAGRTIPR